MGILRAAKHALGGSLADQWLEVIEADGMDDTTLLAPGVRVRARDRRSRGSDEVIPNGSLIQVAENQFMLLVDGGRIIDYTAEPGYYQVENSASPSLFQGEFGEALEETFNRLRFGGVTPYSQKVYFINLQEIKNIAFGTPNPINYFDNFYNAELYLRAHGFFSVKIENPLQFFAEAAPRDAARLTVSQLQQLYLAEFLTALQTSIGRMSVDGVRISHLPSKTQELADYLSQALDDSWRERRGMQIQSVGISSLSYDQASKKLIELRNQGAMLSDPSIRQGYIQGAMARGLEAAGSNPNGAAAGFLGVGLGSQSAGGFLGAAGELNLRQQERQEDSQPGWTCRCGAKNTGNFCGECGAPRPAQSGWRCSCGAQNTGRFCSQCGAPRPMAAACPACGQQLEGTARFCPNCGQKL